jgi:hypothetical protein
VTGDEKVSTTTDVIALRAKIGHGYDQFFDVNGDGVVDAADQAIVAGRNGTGV